MALRCRHVDHGQVWTVIAEIQRTGKTTLAAIAAELCVGLGRLFGLAARARAAVLTLPPVRSLRLPRLLKALKSGNR